MKKRPTTGWYTCTFYYIKLMPKCCIPFFSGKLWRLYSFFMVTYQRYYVYMTIITYGYSYIYKIHTYTVIQNTVSAKLKHCWNYIGTWSWSFQYSFSNAKTSFSNAETIVYFQLDSVKFPSAETWCVSFSQVSAVRKRTEKFPQRFSQLKPDVVSFCTVSAIKKPFPRFSRFP